MYISIIIIDGFRGFKHSEIEFQEGLNVIIGHNNGGKNPAKIVKTGAIIVKRKIVDPGRKCNE